MSKPQSLLDPEDLLDRVRDCEIRTVDQAKGILETQISDKSVDRYRSIILPAGMDKHIGHYRANPVFVWAHNPDLLLGRSERVWRSGDEVFGRFQFDMKSAFASNIFRLYEEKFVRGFSIRTKPHEVFFSWDSKRKLDELEGIDPDCAQALREGKADYVITEHEYIEISGCTIPGNRYALKRAVDSGLVTFDFAAELADLASSRSVPNAVRKEAKKMSPEEQKAFADSIVSRVLENLPKPAPKADEERGLNEKQKAEIQDLVRQTTIDTIAEIYS